MRQEAHPAQQPAGIERAGSVPGHERAALVVVPTVKDLGLDGVTQSAPTIYRCGQPGGLDGVDHPVGRDPRHDLGVGEVLTGSADLPQAVVGLLPGPFEVLHQSRLDVPAVVGGVHERLAGEGQAVQDLTPDVELQLVCGGVADPDR